MIHEPVNCSTCPGLWIILVDLCKLTLGEKIMLCWWWRRLLWNWVLRRGRPRHSTLVVLRLRRWRSLLDTWIIGWVDWWWRSRRPLKCLERILAIVAGESTEVILPCLVDRNDVILAVVGIDPLLEELVLDLAHD